MKGLKTVKDSSKYRNSVEKKSMQSILFVAVIFISGAFCVPWTQHKFELSPRIFNGLKAQSNQFPYMVSLRQIKQMDSGHIYYDHFCGAAIISDRWMISAAHCSKDDNLNSTNIRAFVGVHHIAKGGIKYKIEKIIIHENYNKTLKLNDISLLRTASLIWFNDDIQPIAISKDVIEPGLKGEFAGFGVTGILSSINGKCLWFFHSLIFFIIQEFVFVRDFSNISNQQ